MDQSYHNKLAESLKARDRAFAPLSLGNLMISAFDDSEFSFDRVIMFFDMQTLLIKMITHNCFDIWGLTKQEMEGMNISKLIHPNDLDASILLADRGLLESAPVRNYKNRQFDKGGNVIFLNWNTTETINKETLCFVHRITEVEFYNQTKKL